jgi:hypothetical protein
MMLIPTCPRMAPCSPPSSTLRAGSAGGLKAMLDRGEHDAWGKSGRGKETAPFSRTKKHACQQARETTGGQFLMSSRGQFLMSLDTSKAY